MTHLPNEDFYDKYTNWTNDEIFIAEALAEYEFIPMVEGDKNRVEDILWNRDDDDEYASCLDVIVLMADELVFQTAGSLSEGSHYEWYFALIENLGIESVRDVPEACERMVFRQYDKNGVGGLFPSKHYREDEDARDLDLWYQMQVYLRGLEYRE